MDLSHASASSLDHMPGAHWQFDESVTEVFDDMLSRSIPDIETMRHIVVEVASRFIVPGTHVLDLGCSLGTAMDPLIERFGAANTYVGVEASPPMVEACRARFRDLIARGVVDVRNDDLRVTYPDVEASITLSILTLMFTPIEHRFRILETAFHHTVRGGAFVLVEKVLGGDARTAALIDDLYRQHKRRMGYTEESITRKALALEGVLVPVTAAWNEQMLLDAGFGHVECVWRCLNFAGWVALKI